MYSFNPEDKAVYTRRKEEAKKSQSFSFNRIDKEKAKKTPFFFNSDDECDEFDKYNTRRKETAIKKQSSLSFDPEDDDTRPEGRNRFFFNPEDEYYNTRNKAKAKKKQKYIHVTTRNIMPAVMAITTTTLLTNLATSTATQSTAGNSKKKRTMSCLAERSLAMFAVQSGKKYKDIPNRHRSTVYRWKKMKDKALETMTFSNLLFNPKKPGPCPKITQQIIDTIRLSLKETNGHATWQEIKYNCDIAEHDIGKTALFNWGKKNQNKNRKSKNLDVAGNTPRHCNDTIEYCKLYEHQLKDYTAFALHVDLDEKKFELYENKGSIFKFLFFHSYS